MTRYTPPPHREEFEKRINEMFEAIRGSKKDFARFLQVDASTVSKRLSPDVDTHVSSFFQIIADFAALRLVSPDLAFDIWKEVCLEVEKLFSFETKSHGNFADVMKKLNDRYGDLVKAKFDGQPLNKLISISADIETDAGQVKEELIGMRNDQYFYGRDGGIENA